MRWLFQVSLGHKKETSTGKLKRERKRENEVTWHVKDCGRSDIDVFPRHWELKRMLKIEVPEEEERLTVISSRKEIHYIARTVSYVCKHHPLRQWLCSKLKGFLKPSDISAHEYLMLQPIHGPFICIFSVRMLRPYSARLLNNDSITFCFLMHVLQQAHCIQISESFYWVQAKYSYNEIVSTGTNCLY